MLSVTGGKIRIKCLHRLAKEECGLETDRPDIRGGPICNDVALITPTTHLLDLYTIYVMKYQVLSIEWCIKIYSIVLTYLVTDV